MNVKITRSKFESLVEDLVDRSFKALEQALSDSKMSKDEITNILLVGGMTRMPMVQSKVEAYFGRAPRKDVNPDEAVASGAAIQGGVLSGDVNDVLLLDVTPLSFGIETMGGVMTKIIEKNTTIPTEGFQTFSTAEDNQDAVTIHVLQGERPSAAQNKSLGQFNLEGIPPATRGTPEIEVKFKLDADGILEVSAEEKKTGIKQNITIQANGGMSDEDIENAIRQAEENKEADELFSKQVEERNKSESLIYAVNKRMDGATDDNVSAKITALQTAVNDNNLDEMIAKQAELQTAIQDWNAAQQPQADVDAPEAESEAESTETDNVVDAEFEEIKD